MLGFEFSVVLAIYTIFLLAGFVKGVLGFGLPLFTMSFLPFFVPVEMAIVLSTLVQPITNVGQLIGSGGFAGALRTSFPILLSLLPGVAVGAWYLTSLDNQTLLFILGVAVVAFSLFNLSGYQVRIRDNLRFAYGLVTGFLAGVTGALTSINGPVYIFYLLGIGQSRAEFRSTIALLFIVSGTLISSGFWVIGIVTAKVFMFSMTTLLPAFAGMWIGNLVGSRMPAEAFLKLVLFALIAMGCVFMYRSFQ